MQQSQQQEAAAANAAQASLLSTSSNISTNIPSSVASTTTPSTNINNNKTKAKKTFSLGFDKILNFMAAPLSPSNPEPNGGYGGGLDGSSGIGGGNYCSCRCFTCSKVSNGLGGGGGFFASLYHHKPTASPSLDDQDESYLIDTNAPLDIYGLRYLLLLDRFSRQDDYRESLQLHTHLLGIALATRVYQSMNASYAHLHDLFKNEQRAEFAAAYNYLQDRQDVILEYALAAPQPKSSFLDYISFKCSKTVLAFVSFVRQNPELVASAFQQMSPPDLDNLSITEKFTLSNNNSNSRQNIPNINQLDIVDLLLKGIFGPSTFPQEDRLRLNMWTAIFVKLITDKKGEKFLLDVLDRYVHLSPWTAKRAFEMQLMKILQQGDLLLESATNEQIPKDESYTAFSLPFFGILGGNNNNGNTSMNNATSRISNIEKYLDNACIGLLQVLDREDVIPARVLILSRTILNQVPEESRRHASVFLIVQWFFHRFIGRAITYPEHYGMFEEYYVSETQRRHILFMIQQRLYRYITGITDAVPEWARKEIRIDEKIKKLVEKIVTRFSNDTNYPETNEKPSSIPQMATPALKSAAGTPYPSISQYPSTITPNLLLCPSDLTTLFYFLCPRYRPQQRVSRPNMSPKISKWNNGSAYQSRTNSPRPSSILSLALDEKISAASSLFFPTNSDTSSVSSSSSAESSCITDVQMMASPNGLNINNSEQNHSPIHRSSHSRTSSLVDDNEPIPQIYEDMKKTIDEITKHSGSKPNAHPSAEPWALLYVSRDGTEILLSHPSLAIDTSQSNQLTVTTPIVRGHLGTYGSSGELSDLELDMQFDDGDELNELLTEEVRTIGRALFRILREYDFVEELSTSPNTKSAKTFHFTRKIHGNSPTTITISSLLSKAIQTAQSHRDYAAALAYHQALTLLLHQPRHLTHNNAAGLIALLATPLRRAQSRRHMRHQKRRHWAVYAHEVHIRLVQCLSQKRDMLSSLRLRMWYTSEIRTSKILEKSKINLNEISLPSNKLSKCMKKSNSSGVANNKHKTTSKAFEEWPPPLSEHDSEVVSRWLHETGVYNFIPCEERFHRYCIEINAIRANIMQTMLWTSDLFRKEAMAFKMGYFINREEREKNKRYSGLHYQLFNNNPVNYQYAYHGGEAIRRQNSLGDVFSLNTPKRERRGSVATVGSGPTVASGLGTLLNRSIPRRSSSSNLGLSSANLYNVIEGQTTDTTTPQLNRGLREHLIDGLLPSYELYTPPMNLPPSFLIGAKRNREVSIGGDSGRSSFSSTSSTMDEFTLQTQLKLTGLLLSEFGKAWYGGCETDEWFEEFIDDIGTPKEVIVGQLKNGILIKGKDEDEDEDVLGGKGIDIPKLPSKNFESLTTQIANLDLSTPDIPIASEVSITETESTETQLADALERSPFIPPKSTINERIPNINNEMNSQTCQPIVEYPFTKCCQSLMEEFTLLSSPYQKLHALFAIEMLVVASLSFAPPLPHLSSALSTPTSAPLSPMLIASPLLTAITSTQAVTPGTDSIVNELERLFRQSSIRPKNLFRDMQLIATFVPGVILDLRDEGKAFWDMSLAVSSLKKEVVEKVVERGIKVMDGGIVKRDTLMRMEAEKENEELFVENFYEEDSEMKTQMEAVRLFTIGAKESNPIAQRELAILYLSLPTLPRSSSPPPSLYYPTNNGKISHQHTHVTSINSTIFGSFSALSTSTPVLTSSSFSTHNFDLFSTTKDDKQKYNPTNVAAAIHWFRLAAQQGEKFSERWLNHRDGRQVGELAGAKFFVGSEDSEDGRNLLNG
ncbi:12271_t:CDS:2 [Ambispora gerdemannii]|uniref:12271_t:CDS:1 n=1 Tax=Ambispora gerdemannii TaxID=144530 RepID=A0A9N9EZ80_9GLOM|nr:12271_t:CDS:2 [Ambispora gerdemannii]